MNAQTNSASIYILLTSKFKNHIWLMNVVAARHHIHDLNDCTWCSKVSNAVVVNTYFEVPLSTIFWKHLAHRNLVGDSNSPNFKAKKPDLTFSSSLPHSHPKFQYNFSVLLPKNPPYSFYNMPYVSFHQKKNFFFLR